MSAPAHADVGRKFYSNLGFFMQTFAVPDGSNATERQEYLRIVRLIDAHGGLKPGALAEIEENFRKAEERHRDRGW